MEPTTRSDEAKGLIPDGALMLGGVYLVNRYDAKTQGITLGYLVHDAVQQSITFQPLLKT